MICFLVAFARTQMRQPRRVAGGDRQALRCLGMGSSLISPARSIVWGARSRAFALRFRSTPKRCLYSWRSSTEMRLAAVMVPSWGSPAESWERGLVRVAVVTTAATAEAAAPLGTVATRSGREAAGGFD